MIKRGIHFKLWIGMMALVFVVIILLWMFQIVFLKSFYTNKHISDIKSEASSILKLVEGSENQELKNKLDQFSFNNNLSAELFDKNGISIYLAGSQGGNGQMPMINNHARTDILNQALSGKVSEVQLTHPRFGNKFMLIGLPVSTNSQISGVLLINMPLAPVEDTVAILKQQLLYITIILLAASLLISFIISRSFTKPILKIKKVSESMASGDFSVRINTNKQDELGKLAETINYMGQQLSKIESLRKDLVANVSHELRTPLSLIRGYAETIRDVTGDVQEKREKQLEIIIEETERLSGIVDDILNLSQLQAGYSKLDKSTFAVQQLLDNVMPKYDDLREKTGIDIVLKGDASVPVEADISRMEQVLHNLIYNAFNHTPKGGKITIVVIDKIKTVRIEVTDTGAGIEPEDIPHIWDRYYRAENKKEKTTIGSGLGLAIVKGVLQAHEAQFGVESIIGTGTTFWFEIGKNLLN